MAAVRFDTLDYARKLERAGVPREQAALQAKALGEALEHTVYAERFERLETRFDRLEAKVDALEAKVDRGFAEIDARFAEVDARFAQSDARFEHLEAKLVAKIDAVELKLTGKIATLQWMFGVMVALNATVLIQLLFRH